MESRIEERLRAVEAETLELRRRNVRVDMDKAWERSHSRRIAICLLTYIITMIVFKVIGVPEFHLSAIIPTLGYYLSTLSLPVFKEKWISSEMNKSDGAPFPDETGGG